MCKLCTYHSVFDTGLHRAYRNSRILCVTRYVFVDGTKQLRIQQYSYLLENSETPLEGERQKNTLQMASPASTPVADATLPTFVFVDGCAMA